MTRAAAVRGTTNSGASRSKPAVRREENVKTKPKRRPPDRSTLAANLRARRRAAGLTIEAAARKLGVAMNTWSRWELGTAVPPIYPTLARIAVLLGTSEAELLTEVTNGKT